MKLFRAVIAVLLVLWMISIFDLSAQTAVESQKVSGGFSYRIFSVIYPGFDDMTSEEQQQIVSAFSFPVRKLAHFSSYFVLGVLSGLFWYSFGRLRPRLRALFAWILCVLYAASDELHQVFVPGRSGELRDVLIDSSGALLAVLLCSLVIFSVRRLRRWFIAE